MTESLLDGAAVPLPIRAAAIVASAVVKAARQLLTDLERGHRVDAAVLRNAMEAAFATSDATGAWNWKMAYDACEAATVLFLRRYGAAVRAKAASPAALLPMLLRIASLLPTQTRRCRFRAFARACRSDCPKASFLRPTLRCAPMNAEKSFRASVRSSNGWAPTSMESSFSTRATPCRTRSAVNVLAKLLEHYPVERTCEREAA
jgi:hypothetical protein